VLSAKPELVSDLRDVGEQLPKHGGRKKEGI